MIRLDERADQRVSDYLAGPSVWARLRVESWRGGRQLDDVTVGSGRIRFDGTDMRGLLDVDVQVDRMGALSPSHPIGPYGQTLRAWWGWPDLNIEVPIGWWMVDMPVRRDRLWWSVTADPVGPARLRAARWMNVPTGTVSGAASSQLGQMVAEAGVRLVPAVSWSEDGLGDTVCDIDRPVIESVDDVLGRVGGRMWPARDSDMVMIGRPKTGSTPDWTVGSGKFNASIDTERFKNEITVWYEVPGTPPTYASHTESLMGGPRAADGPMGRRPVAVKLDASVTAADLRTIARQRLRELQLSEASISVTTRADPRREVGDLWRAQSEADGIDCLCRCTGIELHPGDGSMLVEGAVIEGTVGGVSTTFTDVGL